MNVHPLLVHFPIALLITYSVLELVRIKKIQNLPYWFYIKATFAILGAISTIPTYLAGEAIEHQFKNKAQLVETHSMFAKTSMVIFAIIAAAYLIEFFAQNNLFGIKLNGKLNTIWILKQKIAKFTLSVWIIVPLALLGLTAIIVTSVLGGIIVYGPGLDPFTSFIYNLFFGN